MSRSSRGTRSPVLNCRRARGFLGGPFLLLRFGTVRPSLSSGRTLRCRETEPLELGRSRLLEICRSFRLRRRCCGLDPLRSQWRQPQEGHHASSISQCPTEARLWLRLLSLPQSSACGSWCSFEDVMLSLVALVELGVDAGALSANVVIRVGDDALVDPEVTVEQRPRGGESTGSWNGARKGVHWFDGQLQGRRVLFDRTWSHDQRVRVRALYTHRENKVA